MGLCLLSRDSHGDTTKLNHEETVRGPEIAISPGKSTPQRSPWARLNLPVNPISGEIVGEND